MAKAKAKTAAECEARGKFLKAGKCSSTRPPTAAECAAQGKTLSAAGNCVKAAAAGGAPRRPREAVPLRDSVGRISRPAIRRLAHAGGVATLGGLVAEQTRSYLKLFLDSVLSKAVLYAQHARRKRASAADVAQALELLGFRALAAPSSTKALPACKAAKGDLAKRVAHHHARFGTCLHIPKAAFSRLAREVALEHARDASFTADALLQLQFAAESYLVRLFSASADVLVAAGRKTLQPQDMQAAKAKRGY